MREYINHTFLNPHVLMSPCTLRSPSEPLVALPLPLPQLVNARLRVAELGGPRDVPQTVLELVQLPQRGRSETKIFLTL